MPTTADLDPTAYDPPLAGRTTAADVHATRADLAWATRRLAASTSDAERDEFTERVAAMEADLAWEIADHRYRQTL